MTVDRSALSLAIRALCDAVIEGWRPPAPPDVLEVAQLVADSRLVGVDAAREGLLARITEQHACPLDCPMCAATHLLAFRVLDELEGRVAA